MTVTERDKVSLFIKEIRFVPALYDNVKLCVAIFV